MKTEINGNTFKRKGTKMHVMLIHSFFVKHRAKFRLDLGFSLSSDLSTINNPKKGKNSRQQKEIIQAKQKILV